MDKKRVLVFGYSPLYEENPPRISCPEIRTGIFVHALRKEHNVRLISICDQASNLPELEPGIHYTDNFGFEYYAITRAHFRSIKKIKEIAVEFNPDVMIGVNSFPSFYAAITGLQIPFWADLNGSMMMEGQLRAVVDQSSEIISKFWEIEKNIIQRADKFSVVSTPQKFELIGELGIVGRLNRLNSSYEFVEVIPEPIMNNDEIESKNRDLYKKEDFVILWMGGFNYWTDVNFLFKVTSKAVSKNPKIKFLVLGGDISGQSSEYYKKFKNMVGNSGFSENIRFTGWVKTSDLPHYISLADMGINIDKFSYETLLGARYRIVEMLRNGLPVLTTLGSEITYDIRDNGLGFVSEIGDVDAFAENIHLAADLSTEKLQSFQARVRRFALSELSSEKLLQPVLDWVQNPISSPDHEVIVSYNRNRAILKKLFTLSRLIRNPLEFFRVFKRKLSAFLNG